MKYRNEREWAQMVCDWVCNAHDAHSMALARQCARYAEEIAVFQHVIVWG